MVYTKSMKFDWDNDKEQINIKKHGISFKKALQVFLDSNSIDSNSIEIFDEAHSDEKTKKDIKSLVFFLQDL